MEDIRPYRDRSEEDRRRDDKENVEWEARGSRDRRDNDDDVPFHIPRD